MTLLAVTPILPEPEKLMDIGIRVGLSLLVAFVALRVLFLLVGRAERWVVRVGGGSPHATQRAKTIGQILRSMCSMLVGIAVSIHVLALLGWDVKPLLGAAGIVGVALGFGAQTLVRDLIAGLFIIAEDQFTVGDLVEVNGKAATVEALSVRSTTLRDFNGFLYFVPNGEMKVVVNRSRGWTRLAIDVPVSSDENLDEALRLCRRAVASINGEHAWRSRLLDEVEVWGVESLGASEAQIRIVVRARPGPDAHETARELRRRVQAALIEGHIALSGRREIAIQPVPASEELDPASRVGA